MEMKIRIFALLLLVGAFWGGSALAANGPLVDMYVVNDRGQLLQEYRHNSDLFVIGEPRQRYSLRLHNNTSERVLAVVSIDGVNIISGQTAGTWQRGYVLNPYATIDVDGWRKSLNNVARFYFTSVGDSYAARTGRVDNVGVIGLAVFREKERVRRYNQTPYGIYSDQAPRGVSAQSREVSPQLGTGHGESQYSFARQTMFERESAYPAQVSEIRYNSYANLVRFGIIPEYDYRQRYYDPRSFPQGYVPDPPRSYYYYNRRYNR